MKHLLESIINFVPVKSNDTGVRASPDKGDSAAAVLVPRSFVKPYSNVTTVLTP